MSLTFKFYIAVASILFPASALAACPALVPGAAFPWQKGGTLPGDQFATLYIDVATNGRPTACRVGVNNLPDSEARFFMCQAMMAQGRFEAEYKNGAAVASTVKREMLMYGREHIHQEDIARKKYFAEHSEERPSCYPY